MPFPDPLYSCSGSIVGKFPPKCHHPVSYHCLVTNGNGVVVPISFLFAPLNFFMISMDVPLF